jgi:putative transposase
VAVIDWATRAVLSWRLSNVLGLMDNVFIERFWRSLKHEDIYLKGYADSREARAGISSWIEFYNTQRPHSSLTHRTPMEVFYDGPRAVDMMDNACALLHDIQEIGAVEPPTNKSPFMVPL